jgi:hypothetical protein
VIAFSNSGSQYMGDVLLGLIGQGGWYSLSLVVLVLLCMKFLTGHVVLIAVLTDIGVSRVPECHSDLVHTQVLVEATMTGMMIGMGGAMGEAVEDEMIMIVMVGGVGMVIGTGMMIGQEEIRTATKMMDMVGIENVMIIAQREASMTSMIAVLRVIVIEIGAMKMMIDTLPGKATKQKVLLLHMKTQCRLMIRRMTGRTVVTMPVSLQ